jgi:hypothetical protein
VVLSKGVDDRLIWRWSAFGSYSTSSAYVTMFIGHTQILGAKETWKVKAPNKCRFFLWLVLHGRNWTSEHAWRHSLHDNSRCTLCDQEAETMEHLLVACPYVRQVWFKALRHCGWQGLAPLQQDSFVDWLLLMQKRIPKQRRKAFDSLTILCSWSIWLKCNARVFEGCSSSPAVKLDAMWALCDLCCRAI